jgi:hypothetical protein
MSPQAASAQLSLEQIATVLTRTDFPQLLPVQVTGDYNSDGRVDVADYAVWRTTFGSRTNLAADGNGNLLVDAGDYIVWRSEFGERSGAGGLAGAAVAPEPAGAILAPVGAVLFARLVAAGRMRPPRKRRIMQSRPGTNLHPN